MDSGPWSGLPFLLRDQRLTVYHLAIYIALCDLWRMQGQKRQVYISRRMIMHLSKIRSLPTYHKHLQQLEEFNYISYFPSYHPRRQSAVCFKYFSSDLRTLVAI